MASLANMPFMPPMGHRKRHHRRRSKTLQAGRAAVAVMSAQLCPSRVQGPVLKVPMQLHQGFRLLASASGNSCNGTLQDWHQEEPCWPGADLVSSMSPAPNSSWQSVALQAGLSVTTGQQVLLQPLQQIRAGSSPLLCSLTCTSMQATSAPSTAAASLHCWSCGRPSMIV